MRTRLSVLVGLVLALALPGAAQEPVTLKIAKDLEVKDFLDQVSRAVGKPVLYDPNGQRIRGQKFNVDIEQRVPADRLLDTFRAILAFHELTLIPVGPRGHEILLVLDSRSTNNLVKNKAKWVEPAEVRMLADRDGLYIACAFPLQHIQNRTVVRTALATMVSPAGIGRVHEYTGGILVMDFAPTVAAISRVLLQMDSEAATTAPAMETIELAHAHAHEMAGTLNKLMADPPEEQKIQGQRRTSGSSPMRPRIVPYEPRNAIIVYAAQADVARIKALVATLDLPARAWKAEK